jgi:mercuric ion transport protein
MRDSTIVRTGIAGSIVAAVCCVTPVLTVLLGAVGLAAWLGWADYALFPALAAFLAMTAYGLWRRQRATACCDAATGKPAQGA